MSKKKGLVAKARCGSKKGQVTVFIIVGIVLLFVFAGIYYATQDSVEKSLEPAQTRASTSSAPSVFNPIQLYTENCVEQITTRGLRILGEQGGYIYPDLVGKYSQTDPTNADGILMQPLKIPYWHYNTQPNEEGSIAFSSLKPALYSQDDETMSIEAQLSRYISENVDGCLADYVGFEEQGFSIEQHEIEGVDVIIAPKAVHVELDMDVSMKQGDEQAEYELFGVSVPIELPRMYEQASEILELQQNLTFMERQAMNLIHTYSAVDPNSLPPVHTIEFDLVPTASWVSEDIKADMTRLLQTNVPMLRPIGANNFYRFEYAPGERSELYQAYYDNSLLYLPQASGLDVYFDYFGWEPYLNINNGEDYITPTGFSRQYLFFQMSMQNYYTTYDVSYPVLVRVEDKAALNGEGFTLNFAMESNLRNNKPAIANSNAPKQIINTDQTMLCDDTQFDTQILRSVVVDSHTKEPLDLVQIGFSLPELENCNMGLTNNEGTFDSKYPAVYGGQLSLIKTDYLTNFYPINTYQFKQDSIAGAAALQEREPLEQVFELHRIRDINVTVKKKEIVKCIGDTCYPGDDVLFREVHELVSYKPELLSSTHRWSFPGATRQLGESESAIIVLKRINEGENGIVNSDHIVTISVNGDQTTQTSLVPGTYEVNGFVFYQDSYLLPEEERCDEGVLIDDCFTFDEQLLDSLLLGQVEWNDQKSYLTIEADQLYEANNIEFYLPSINILSIPAEPHKRVIEDLKVMGELGNISRHAGVRHSIAPRFS